MSRSLTPAAFVILAIFAAGGACADPIEGEDHAAGDTTHLCQSQLSPATGERCGNDQVCVDDHQCYPLAGEVGGECDPARAFTLQMAIDGIAPNAWQRGLTVTAVRDGAIDFASDQGSAYTLSYDFGGHAPPIGVGAVVDVLWVADSFMGIAEFHALVIRDSEGRLLAAADDSNGWIWDHALHVQVERPDGIRVEPRLDGCAAERDPYGVKVPAGLAFAHPDGAVAFALPGEAATLSTPHGDFIVVNAETYRWFELGAVSERWDRGTWVILADVPPVTGPLDL